MSKGKKEKNVCMNSRSVSVRRGERIPIKDEFRQGRKNKTERIHKKKEKVDPHKLSIPFCLPKQEKEKE